MTTPSCSDPHSQSPVPDPGSHRLPFKVIAIGEVLWDLLPSGPQLGGAPGNFGFHARQLGAAVQLVTRVGNDALGQQALRRFLEMNIDVTMVQVDDQLPTGTASVSLERDGTPHFTIDENVAWDALAPSADALKSVQTANAICFGSLAQRTGSAASVIQQWIAAAPKAALRVFDINLRQTFYSEQTLECSLAVANVLKLNDAELAVLSPMFSLKGSANEQIIQLATRFNLQLVALTRAERGILLYQAGNWSDLRGRKIEIVDAVGAGDAFTAALVMGLLQGFRLEEIHRLAADIATFVCSCPGATPELPQALRSAFLKAGETLPAS